jgi:hypothetical protein
MVSVLLAALIAAPQPTARPAPAPLDVGCFRLMAEFAEDEDPRVQSVGRVGAQYFLGRIDAAAPGFDIDSAGPAPDGAERAALLRRCGDSMQRAGHDFRAIGRTLEPPRPAT